MFWVTRPRFPTCLLILQTLLGEKAARICVWFFATWNFWRKNRQRRCPRVWLERYFSLISRSFKGQCEKAMEIRWISRSSFHGLCRHIYNEHRQTFLLNWKRVGRFKCRSIWNGSNQMYELGFVQGQLTPCELQFHILCNHGLFFSNR